MFILMIVNFTYNFREYGIKNIDNKATILAKTVEHALTTQMQTGVIDQREMFLKQLEDLPNIDKIWLSRGHKVIDMYGKGFNNEVPRDDIDKKVLKTGEEIKIINENIFSNSTYRITIPYKATKKGAINCLECHTNSNEGDTLGAITITIPVDDSKQMGISTVLNTTAIALIVIFVIGFLINYLISPFLKLFVSIKQVMSKAQNGNYSHRVINIKNNKDAQDVSSWVNTLLEKLESTLNDIDSKISIFLSNKQEVNTDPLINVQNTINRLSSVYKFRKTIEHDDNSEEIYKRLANIIRDILEVDEFNIIEANTRTGKKTIVYKTKNFYCDTKSICRADKTNEIVDSSQFKNICKSCQNDDLNYICIPYSISNDLDLVISIYTKHESQNQKIREKVPLIKDYIDGAKPVIISNKLMNILEKNAKTDPLTGLYNRKFLDEESNKIIEQAKRARISYGILMLDIDHFKIVNDTYGHDVGDNAIKIVAQTLNENTRTSDIVVRFGGEEFIILLYNCNKDYLIDVADKIRIAFMEKEIPAGNETITKTMSIGCSIFPTNSNDIQTCIKYADTALYKAKQTGRNKTVLYTEDLNNS
ncbi:MAG: GGDEF domain-containing protein [Campylobacterota bacterium]